MKSHPSNRSHRGIIDSGVLWMLGAAALYFAMQMWILPKFGVST
jgi:hypothetical protein